MGELGVGHMKNLLILIAVLCIPFITMHADSQPDIYSTAFWLVPGSPGKITWIEIRNIEEAKTTGIAHVWVLARKKGYFESVCDHIAITTEALRRSVIRPCKPFSPLYPERYEQSLRNWESDEKQGKAIICTTSIVDYLKQQK